MTRADFIYHATLRLLPSIQIEEESFLRALEGAEKAADLIEKSGKVPFMKTWDDPKDAP